MTPPVTITPPVAAPPRVADPDDLWAEVRASLAFLFGGLALTAGVVAAVGLLLPAVR